MSGHLQAHRRHARSKRGFFDPSHFDPSTETDGGDDWLTFLFPPDSSESTTSSESSTTTPLFPPLITTAIDPFSTSADPLTTLTTSTTSSSSTSTSTSSSSPSSSTSPLPSLPTTTVTSHVTPSATDAAASSTNSAASTGGVSAGKIVGGIGAGVIALAALFALAAFFLRRMRRRREENADHFDSPSFHGPGVLIPDAPTHEDTVAAGFNPRSPPGMTERRPATFDAMYGVPHGAFSPATSYGAQYGYTPGPYPNPFIPQTTSVQSPISPAEPPTNPFDDSPVAATPLRRQSSGHSNEHAIRDSGAAGYVDLDRSSATQAQMVRAQYVEFPVDQSSTQNDSQSEQPPPVPAKERPGSSVSQHIQDLKFPMPPSPAASKYGVPTTPPVLPEILVRDSGYGFPSPSFAARFPSRVSEVAAGQTLTMKANTEPATPTPMASSFTLTPNESEFKPLTTPAVAHVPQKRPETVYSLEDAYGGF